jgi:hypothetical protein
VTNLVIPQGTDRPVEIANVRDGDGTLITNWAGYSVLAQVRERPDSATVLYTWTSSGGSPNVSFDGATIVLEIAHAVSSAWTWRSGRYDVELTNPSGDVDRIAEGSITVSREVTR